LNSAAFHVKDAEDWATLVEAKNIVVLASAREDDDGFIRKITLLEGELVA
jgi:hypothetical protein